MLLSDGLDLALPVATDVRRLLHPPGHQLALDAAETQDGPAYEPMSLINEVRSLLSRWRDSLGPTQWCVTPETVRLLAPPCPFRWPSRMVSLADRLGFARCPSPFATSVRSTR
jgi:hypothetical protein